MSKNINKFNTMDISIIIVNYKVIEFLVPCIESIFKHSKSNYTFEIIAIDNNSNDGSIEIIQNKFPKVKIIANKKNYGFSKGVNQGLKKSIGKYLLVLNPDTLFIEDSLGKLLIEATKTDSPKIIGPKLINEKGVTQQSFWRYPTVLNTIISLLHLDFLNFKKNYKGEKINNIMCVDSLSGGALFLPKKLFDKLGGFNETFFWMEDIDICLRAKRIGVKIIYFPLTEVIHIAGASAKKNYKISISNQLLSKIKFFSIHHSRISSSVIQSSILLISIIKSLILITLFPFSKTVRHKLFGYLFTIRRIIIK